MPKTEEINKVHIRIISEINGRKSISGSWGEWRNDLFSTMLVYHYEKDCVTLYASNDEIVMEREGSCYLRLVFHSGQTSTGIIGVSREQSGEVKIRTERAECIRSHDRREINLEYYFLFGREEQKICLRLIAQKENTEGNI